MKKILCRRKTTVVDIKLAKIVRLIYPIVIAKNAKKMQKKQLEMRDKIKILEMIAKDMKDDATNFDGQAFNGRTVAKYCGNLGAAIASLADIVKSILEQEE